MRVGNLLGQREEGHRAAEPRLGLRNRIAAHRRVLLHHLEFLGRQPARLEQDAIRDADLADVVQRRRLVEQLDGFIIQRRRKARVRAQRLGQRTHITLRALDVIAGLVVARLGQRRHHQDRRILHIAYLLRAPRDLLLQEGALVAQEIRCSLELQMRMHASPQDGRVDRLGQVVHRAEAQAHFLVGVVGQGGQKDDGNVARQRVGLELAADGVAIHLGHHDVEQDQVRRRAGPRDLQRPRAAGRHLHLVEILKQLIHQREVLGCVVHHQHHGARGYGCRVHD